MLQGAGGAWRRWMAVINSNGNVLLQGGLEKRVVLGLYVVRFGLYRIGV